VILVTAVVLYLAMYLRWPSMLLQIDLQVYRFGAQRVRDGLDLYSVGLTGYPDRLLFDYPPFAALCLLPLAFGAMIWLDIGCLALMCAMVAYVVWRMLKSSGLTAGGGLWSLTALLVGLAVWLEPIRLTIQLGQINLVVLTLVVADLLGRPQRKWAGVGIGLAAGLKLTPLLFIVYLVAIGRLRAAAVAVATFVATLLVGFAFLPADSRYYWFHHGFDDVRRISRDPGVNTSLAGLFVRMHWPTGLATVLAAVLVVVALVVATVAYRRGQATLAIAVIGMASSAASPFSWSHHWVWFLPLLIHLGYRAYVLRCAGSAWAMWLFWGLFASWFTSVTDGGPNTGVLSLPVGGIWHDILPATYVFAFVAVLLCSAAWLWRSGGDAKTSEPEPQNASHTDREPVAG
jgi:alpha-1,2-mannosyltransferase